MQLTILGCNGLYPVDNLNTSGYLIKSEKSALVLDMGSGVFATLKSIIAPEKIDGIFISHLHFDHVSDLGVFNYYLESKAKSGEFKGKIKLFVKSCESAVYSAIAQLNYFELVDFCDNSTLLVGDFCLNVFRREHPILTFGLTVEGENKRISYSSDGAFDDALKRAILKSDISLCHTPFTFETAKNNRAHASAFEVTKFAFENNKKVLLSHLHPENSKEQLLLEIEKYSQAYEIANQGDTYKL